MSVKIFFKLVSEYLLISSLSAFCFLRNCSKPVISCTSSGGTCSERMEDLYAIHTWTKLIGIFLQGAQTDSRRACARGLQYSCTVCLLPVSWFLFTFIYLPACSSLVFLGFQRLNCSVREIQRFSRLFGSFQSR